MSYIPFLSSDLEQKYKELLAPKKRSFFSSIGSWISYLRCAPIGSSEHKAKALFKKIGKQDVNPALLKALHNAEDLTLGKILVLSEKQPLSEKTAPYLSIIENMLFERTRPSLIPSPIAKPSADEEESSHTLSKIPSPKGPPAPPPPPPAAIKRADPSHIAQQSEELRRQTIKNLEGILREREEHGCTKAFISHLQACIDYLQYTETLRDDKKAAPIFSLRKSLELRKTMLQGIFDRARKGQDILECIGSELQHNSPELESFGKIAAALRELDDLKALVTEANRSIAGLSEENASAIVKTTFSSSASRLQAILPLLQSVTEPGFIQSLRDCEKITWTLSVICSIFYGSWEELGAGLLRALSSDHYVIHHHLPTNWYSFL